MYKGPIKKIPNEFRQQFTMNEKIPIYNVFLDESQKNKEIFWSNKLINTIKSHYTKENILKNKHQIYSMWKHGGEPYPDHRIGDACSLLCKAFNKYPIKNKNIAVIGSTKPWIECILLNYGAKSVTTVEYNIPKCENNNIKTISYYNNFKNTNDKKYDIIVTYSSIEHSGLGRYGDDIDPNGDIKAMVDIYNNLKDDGLLFWGGPIGPDALVWNANRVYGNIRLPMLFEKFKVLEWFGCTLEKALKLPKGSDWRSNYQPVIVLKKIR